MKGPELCALAFSSVDADADSIRKTACPGEMKRASAIIMAVALCLLPRMLAKGTSMLRPSNPRGLYHPKSRTKRELTMSATMPADRVTRANSIHTIRRRTIERPQCLVGSGEKGQTYLYWNEDQLLSVASLLLDQAGLGQQPISSSGSCCCNNVPQRTPSRPTRFWNSLSVMCAAVLVNNGSASEQ